jgi:hypothetical protein
MADEKTPTVERTVTTLTDIEEPEKAKLAVHNEEVQLARLTEEDVTKMASDAFNFWSWTGVRITGLMFVQGCNMAGTYSFQSHRS